MPATNVNPTFIAGGTINPSRFVTMVPQIYSGTTTPTPVDFTIWQATAGPTAEGDRVIGISQEGTSDWQSTDAAAAGEQVRVHGPGEIALVTCGNTVVAGDYLKSDADGKAIPVSADNDRAAGFALQAGATGTKIQVYVHPFIYMAI